MCFPVLFLQAKNPSPEQIGRAVGMLGGGLSEALIVEELLKTNE
jgi:hypothetical protein